MEKLKKVDLKIEELEERIAPGFALALPGVAAGHATPPGTVVPIPASVVISAGIVTNGAC